MTPFTLLTAQCLHVKLHLSVTIIVPKIGFLRLKIIVERPKSVKRKRWEDFIFSLCLSLYAQKKIVNITLLDLFGNCEPSVRVGSLTSLAFFRAKALQKCGLIRKLFRNLSFRTTILKKFYPYSRIVIVDFKSVKDLGNLPAVVCIVKNQLAEHERQRH